jgi:DNA-binding transcriptional regulator of glucitol operon
MGLSREMPHFWVYLIRLEVEVEDGRIGVMQRMVAGTAAENKPKLLEQVRNVIRIKHYSSRTEQAYVDSISASSFSMANVTP